LDFGGLYQLYMQYSIRRLNGDEETL